MQVLHINCNYILSKLHQNLIEELRNEGIDSCVFVPTYDKKRSIIEPENYVIIDECFRKWDRLFYFYKQEKILAAVKRKICVEDYDCIHAYTLFSDGNCAMRLSEEYGIPYVVAIRDTDVNHFFKYRPYLRGLGVRIMRNAKAVFFLSDAYYQHVINNIVPAIYRDEIQKKSYIIPNGIDNFWLDHKAGFPQEKTERIRGKNVRLLYVGRIDKRKNIPTTQKSVDILRGRGVNATLTIVGKPVFSDLADNITEKEFESIKNHPYTQYVPAQPKEELINYYRQSDIFVMPSLRETFGLVYAEAMTQGLPVIYSRKQGFDGQFPEGVAGYAIDSHSPEEAANAVEGIMDQYEDIAKRVPVLAEKFRWSDIARQYCKIYME